MAVNLVSIEEEVPELVVDEVCKRIPPLWPLESFVAVNPFLGLTDRRFEQAACLLDRVGHGKMLMPTEYYLSRIRNGAITAEDVRSALREQRSSADPVDPIGWLQRQLTQETSSERILTVADWLDHSRGTSWASFVVDEISKWCSSYFDRGQATWVMPWKNLRLYEAWKRAAELDANPEMFGLRNFRQHVKQLPESDEEAIVEALNILDISPELRDDFLHRELMSVFGWAAYAAYQDRQGLDGSIVRQLLAIRLAYDTALLHFDRGWRCKAKVGAPGFTEARYIAHLALEQSFRSGLTAQLRRTPTYRGPSSRSALQAVFCIDVRSEPYRRALEAQSPGIETVGFAGFFGMPLEVSSTARCPVLISPKYEVEVKRTDSLVSRFGRTAFALWKSVSRSSSGAFSAVEIGGAWFGLSMLRKSMTDGRSAASDETLQWTISLPQRVDLAAGALKNLGVDTSRLAPVVLICGHGSSTENNPYRASLDCGACGGHKGDVNARFAAALMNDRAVRAGLKERGIDIPQDTVFVGGLHNTTTDEVILYDAEKLLPEERRAQVERWLQSASVVARRERAQAQQHSSISDRELEQEVRRRGADWSEVRPEWGLAGNAAFIAAPRGRTMGLNLEGRVFLHEYDPAADRDGSVLRMILTAPVVVASWINLQYFGSTVDNKLFGSGNKVLHNVTGMFGVWEGNAGDLRTGLPLQSLHNGETWVHEPLRLQVLVEAPRERIDRVLEDIAEVRALFENGWIHLMAIEEASIYEWRGAGQWRMSAK